MARRTGPRDSAVRGTAIRDTAAWWATVWGTAVVLTLAACSGAGDTARTAPVEASGDGILRIGLILDNTGPQAFLNAAQQAAAKLAVQEINAAGGHKGRPVDLLPATTVGDTAAQARELVDAGADVVIGPTDSSRAPAAIDVLSKARITLISPANTAPELSSYKSGGYYFRTAAADIAQAPVLVKLAKDAGARSLAVVYEDGNYGQDVSAAVSAAAKAGGLNPVTLSGFTRGEAQKSVAAARDAAPDAVVVIARDGAQGAIAELTNAGLAGNKLILGDGGFRQYGSALGSKSLEGTRALVPGVFPSAHFQAELVAIDAGLKDTTFAPETYDAVNLAALAAAAAEDDAGASIAGTLISVSGGTAGGRASSAPSGQPAVCTTYKDCLAAIRAGKAIDYDGESGPVRFDANGDVTAAKYMVFTYGADNKARLTGSEAAGRSAR